MMTTMTSRLPRILIIVILTAVLLLSHVHVNAQTEWRPPPQAKLYQPGEPTYIQTPGDGIYNYTWYIVEDRRLFIFEVKACSSVQLAFATYTDTKEEFVVEIALGINDNTRSQIRLPQLLSPNAAPLYNTFTRDILHCNEFRTFWVRWGGDYFVVGKGPIAGEQPLMDWTDQQQRYFNAIGLTSAVASSAIWRINENSASHQVIHTVGDHRYSTLWKSVEQKETWTFSVRAAGNAHILLSEKLGATTGNIYEIAIGEGQDKSTIMLRSQPCLTSPCREDDWTKASVNVTGGLLSQDERREFWISWYRGQIELGRGSMYGKNRLLLWKDPSPFSIRYLSVNTGSDTYGRWYWMDDQETITYAMTYPVESTLPEVIYNQTWIISPRQQFFTAQVKACKDASIVISSNLVPTPGVSIEIVLGASENTRSLIRYLSSSGTIDQMDTPNVLNCMEPRPFWISWSDVLIQVGLGYIYSLDIILKAPIDGTPDTGFKVGGLGLATPSVVGEWRISEYVGERIVVRTPSQWSDFDLVWRTITQKNYFVFRVRACSDCHVALSPTLGVNPAESYMDLTIAGWANTRTELSKVTGIDRESASDTFDTPQLLNCNAHIDLWVSWDEQQILMGRGMLPGYHVLFNHTMPGGMYPVKAVSLSTGFGSDGDFIFDEDTSDYYMFYTSLHDSVRWIEFESQITWFPLRIRACDQIWIYFCTQQSGTPAQDCFSLIIGANGNTKTTLSLRGTLIMEVDTPDIVHCLDSRNFWLRWLSNGKLQVGHGTISGFNTIIDYQNSNPIAITNIGFQSNDNDTYARFQIDRNAVSTVTFFTPDFHTYEQMWESVERRRGITFGVTACSDVHVILSHTLRWFDDVFDLFIGGYHNTKSVIRASWGFDYVTADTVGILDCSERRYFWVTWQYGAIEVGRGEIIGQNKFMDYQPLQLYPVNAIGYSTGWDYTGTWYLKANPALIPTLPPPTVRPSETEAPPVAPKTSMSQDEIAGLILGLLGAALLVSIAVVCIRTRNNSPTATDGKLFSSATPSTSRDIITTSSNSGALGQDE